jgi:hypothetical protein
VNRHPALDRALLIGSYVILVAVVVFGAFYVPHEFNKSHDEQCAIAEAFVDLVAANLTFVANPAGREQAVRLTNEAIDKLNDTCSNIHLQKIPN